MVLKVAIVGNIASGKSMVQKLLENKGFKVFDTDILAHKILQNNKKKILEIFSEFDILDNEEISRKKLAKIVFESEDLKVTLEAVVHPLVKEKLLEIFEANRDEKIIFVAVPLLFEANMQKMFDKILFVKAEDKIRLQRLMVRNNMNESDALLRLNSQGTQEEKIRLSDFVIENNSNIETLECQLDTILKEISK